MAAPKGNQFWKNRKKHGTDKKFTAKQLWEKACDYFQWADNERWEKLVVHGKESNIISVPTTAPYLEQEFCEFAGMAYNTWLGYKASDEDDYVQVTTRIVNIIYTQKFKGAAVGAFNANIIARDLGLRDHKEVSGSVSQKYEIIVNVIDEEE